MKAYKTLIGKQVTVTMTHNIGDYDEDKKVLCTTACGWVNYNNVNLPTYVVGEFKKHERFNGNILAVLDRQRNIPCLVVTDKNKYYTKDQIRALVEFKEQFYASKIVY